MNKPVVFLDIDGVLVPYKERPDNPPFDQAEIDHCLTDKFLTESIWRSFDYSACKLIKKLQKETDCEIVISSSWRTVYSFDKLKSIFSMFGIEIHGSLPSGTPRSKLIKDYVYENKIRYWIALDDMDMEKVLFPHMVKCTGTFKEENYAQALRRLKA